MFFLHVYGNICLSFFCVICEIYARAGPALSEAEWLWFNEKQNAVMAKFPRSELEAILEPGELELTVTGFLTTSQYFYGTDTIRIKHQR